MLKMIPERDLFSLNSDAENEYETLRFLARSPKPVPLSLGHWQLLCSGHTIRLLNEQKNRTLYHVKYEVKSKKLWLDGTRSLQQAVQVEVWRKAGSNSITHGLPKTVFFDYLLPTYGAIFTDYLHTDSGKRFWLDRLDDALNAGYPVFYGDFSLHHTIRIENMDSIGAIYEQSCWGEKNQHAYRRMLIVNPTFLPVSPPIPAIGTDGNLI